MLTIWKYEIIPYQEYFELSLPEGAEVLVVQVQRGVPQMYVLLDMEATCNTVRRFLAAETGQTINETELKYIGTVQLEDGYYVLHVFEVDSV